MNNEIMEGVVLMGLMVLPFIVLIPILISYTRNYHIFASIYGRMLLVNLFAGISLSIIFFPIYSGFADVGTIVVGCLVGIIPLIYYPYFYGELHYKCPHCGSIHTVKTDDSDGEYFNMGFHCKHCNKDFTIERISIGGWPD